MSREQSKSPDYLGFLDGIRGGAALWVLVAHCMIWGGWYGIPLPSPKIAVDIFMVASGFLMVYQYRRRETREPLESWQTALRFWLRRFFRIAPVYYLSLIVLLLFWNSYADGLATLQQAAPQQWAKVPEYNPAHYQVGWFNTFIHATFLFGLLPQYAASNLTPDWSIGLEMQFYAAFPLLYLGFRRYSWVALVAVSVVLAEVFTRWFAQMPGVVPGTRGLFSEPTFLLLKLPLFAIGMLAGESFCQVRQTPGRCALMGAAALVLTAQHSVFVSLATGIILWMTWSKTAEAEGESSIVRRWMHGLLSNRCTAFMADTSYSVYLLHGFFLSFIGGQLFRNAQVLAMSGPMRVGLLAVIIIPAVYLTAWALHHLLERPGIELGRWLINRIPLAPAMCENPSSVSAPGGSGLGAPEIVRDTNAR